MSDDAKAAERLRVFVGCNRLDFENMSVECIRDMWTVDKAYLAEHPADEDEPVTEEWFAQVCHRKYEDDAGGGYRRYTAEAHDDSGYRTVELEVFTTYNDQRFKVCGGEPIRQLTRGQVRLISRALGIPLKEPT